MVDSSELFKTSTFDTFKLLDELVMFVLLFKLWRFESVGSFDIVVDTFEAVKFSLVDS